MYILIYIYIHIYYVFMYSPHQVPARRRTCAGQALQVWKPVCGPWPSLELAIFYPQPPPKVDRGLFSGYSCRRKSEGKR